MSIFFSNEGDVASIFLSYFERAPEFEAMQHYAGVYQSLRTDPATASNAFNLLAAHIYADGVASQEVPAGPTVTDAWYVNYLYGNILGRAPDAGGLLYWTEQLQNGAIERAELVGTFIAAALAAEGRDAAYVENRSFVAVEFAQWENSNPQVLPTLKYDAAEVLLGVNETLASVEAAQGRLETTTGTIGGTWNLTTGIDTFEGTTGNDTFNAVFGSRPGQEGSTLTSFDSIDGNLGFDTLNIYVNGEDINGQFPNTARVSNIEVVNVFNGGFAAFDPAPGYKLLGDLSNYSGLQQFWQIEDAGNVTGVTSDVVVGFRDVDYLFSRVNVNAGVSSATIVLDGSVAKGEASSVYVYGPATGSVLDTVNVLGTLADEESVLRLDVTVGKTVSSLTVNTEVAAEIRAYIESGDAARISTLDFSGSTGDIAFRIAEFERPGRDPFNQAKQLVGENRALNVTFGSGDDLIVFDTRGLTLRDNIDGGEGYDTVVLTLDGKFQTQTYNAIERLQNIDALGFRGDNVEVDAAELVGFDLIFAGGGDVVVSNLAAGQIITVGENIDGGEPDSVELVAAAANVEIEVDSDIFFALLIDDTNAASIGAKGGELSLFGDGGVSFSNAAAGKFTTIDASELDGVETTYGFIETFVNLPGTQAADTEVQVGVVLLGSKLVDDNLVLTSGLSGAVAETVRLNVDTLDLVAITVALESNTPWEAVNSSTYGRMDVIEGFNSTASAGPLDYLVAASDLTLGKFTLSANDTTLQLAFQSAAAAYGWGDFIGYDVMYFTFEGNTYLYADTVSESGVAGQYDNADFALKIVGVHNNLGQQWASEAPLP